MRTRLAVAVASLLLVAACGDTDPADPEADASDVPSGSATPGPSGEPSETPSETPSEEPSVPVTGTPLTTKGLDQGPPPSIDLLTANDPARPAAGWSLARPGGGSVALDVTSPVGFVPTGNGLVVIEDDGAGGTAALSIDGTGGEVTREESLGYRLAATADGSIVAWLSPDGSVHGVEAGGQRSFELPRVEGASELGAISGRGTCFEAESEIGGCTAFVDVDDPRQAWITSSHGIVDIAGPMLSVVDTDGEGAVLGLISVDDQGSCGGLYDEPTVPTWETCDHTLVSFSPDRALVLGTDAYLDGFGQRSVAFLDASDGTLLHELRSKGRGPTVIQTAWEDDQHVLAVVYERGRWSVLRLGADGSVEIALGPVEGSDLERPFILPEQ
jgi:hypothetical protein